MTQPHSQQTLTARFNRPNEGPLYVRRFDKDTNPLLLHATVRGVVSVLRAAYDRRFSNVRDFTSEKWGEIFNPDDVAGLDRRVSHMYESIQNKGSKYFIAMRENPREVSDPQVVGLAKISPSVPRIARLVKGTRPNLFLNDIATAEEGQGIGTLLLGTATMPGAGGFDSDRGMVTHLYNDDPTGVNEWFVRMGLEPQADVPMAKQAFEGLPETIFASAAGITLSSIQHYLRSVRPELAGGRYI